ncbi:MAG TPA: hypothetical protein VNR36_07750 [Pseudolysinimonas sp.]|nr:hypothetical protein [Pseudolysinimonas sp.]
MLAAFLFTALLLLLATFQIALIAGAPLGRFAWGGQHEVLPARLRRGSVLAILIYAGMALIVLDRAGAISIFPAGASAVLVWVVFAYSCLSVVLNAISRSKPERYLMVPVSLALAVLSLLVALS